MPRLLMVASLSFVGLLSACTSAPQPPQRPLQVTGYRSLYRTYWRTGDAVYIRVQAGSPEAVLLAEPDPWAETAALLEYGQRLTVLDESAGGYVSVRTWGLGVDIEGWVTRAAVSAHAPQLSEAEQRGLEEAGASLSKIICTKLPGDDPLNSSALARALAGIDEYEDALSHLRGGDALNPDPAVTRARFRAFGEQGGLLGD